LAGGLGGAGGASESRRRRGKLSWLLLSVFVDIFRLINQSAGVSEKVSAPIRQPTESNATSAHPKEANRPTTKKTKMSFFAGRTAAHQARASFARGGRFNMHTAPPRAMPRQAKHQNVKKSSVPSTTTWPTSKSSPYVCFANLASVQNLNRMSLGKPTGMTMSSLAVPAGQARSSLESSGEGAESGQSTLTTSNGGQGVCGVSESEASGAEVTNGRKRLRKHRVAESAQALVGWNWWDDDC